MRNKPNPPRGIEAIASVQRAEAKDGETKSAQMLVRMKPRVKAAAEKAAADDHRSLTSLIEKLLTEHLKAKGYLK